MTRPVTFSLEVNGFGPDAYGGTRAGFSATTTINRNDFGVDIAMPLDGGGVVVSEKVQVALEIEACSAPVLTRARPGVPGKLVRQGIRPRRTPAGPATSVADLAAAYRDPRYVGSPRLPARHAASAHRNVAAA